MESKKTEEKPVSKGDTYASFFSVKPKLKSADIRKHVFQRFNKGEYGQLKEDLDLYMTKEYLSKFFLKEGPLFLRWALIDAPNNKPLKFFEEKVPSDILQKVLNQENFSVLQSFLLGQVGLEKRGWYDQVKKERQVEKFKALLDIDADGVIGFMEKNATNKNFISETIKDNFANALKQFKEKSSLEQPKTLDL